MQLMDNGCMALMTRSQERSQNKYLGGKGTIFQYTLQIRKHFNKSKSFYYKPKFEERGSFVSTPDTPLGITIL